MIRKKTRNRRMLHNKKSFIFLLILCLGIGFSFLSSQLTITGNTSVSGNKWSVYFDNVKVRDGSVDANTPEIDTNKTTINFTVALDKPGDYYEFTVDAKNDGTIDAIIGSVTKTELDANIAKYLNYTVTYDNELELKQNDILVAKDKTTYKVLVEYKKNITASDLSEESINLNLSFTVNYAQSDKKPESFATMAKKNALNDTSIDFKQVSSDTNGKGLYLLSGTENDTNPIYYYRGEVYNNNALFAGYCWKIVRTTETGGTKLIYNGEPKKAYLNSKNVEKDSYANVENAETYPFTFDSTNNEFVKTYRCV